MNNQDNIKTIFDKAAELVKNLPESLQEKAFELAVIQLSSQNTVPSDSKNKSVVIITDEERSDFFIKLEKETGLSIEQLKGVYKRDKDGDIKIVAPLTGNAAEIQRRLAYLYLLGVRFGNGEEWVSALKFANKAKDYGVNDGHISKNLLQDKSNILQGGRKRGKEYALTPNGVLKAKELLSGIV